MKNPLNDLMYQGLYAVSVLLAIAFALRWAYELIKPVLPVLVVVLVLAVAGRLFFTRWR